MVNAGYEKNQIFYAYLFWKLQWSSANIPKQISGDNINNIGTPDW